jgi:hypothetical protein
MRTPVGETRRDDVRMSTTSSPSRDCDVKWKTEIAILIVIGLYAVLAFMLSSPGRYKPGAVYRYPAADHSPAPVTSRPCQDCHTDVL